jgi:hypothetical protein
MLQSYQLGAFRSTRRISEGRNIMGNGRVSEVVSRRRFLQFGLMGGCGLALAACGPRGPLSRPPITPTPAATPTPRPDGAEVIVGDVLDYALTSDEWPGAFGWVTFRLREGLYEGQPVYFIRTDGSDEGFCNENGLAWAPLLLGAEEGPQLSNTLYTFEDGRPPVMQSIPGQEDFLSLFQIVPVSGPGAGGDFGSAAEIEDAVGAGDVTLSPSNIYVNYPVVKWPGGELPVDDDLTSYLGTGQLLEPVDTAGMTVKMKLHEGFPGSRYIVTDTSQVELAPDVMHIAQAAASGALAQHNAVDEVFVFANGLPGSGVLGFQPAVFGSTVDSRIWSPFWDHFTVEWLYEDRVRVLHNSFEVYDAIEHGELMKYNGLPNTHPDGFVVNCPIPVLADNTFEG